MLKDNDAVNDAAAASLTKLRKMFGTRLYAAAELLVDTGSVFDVRTMRNGRVVAGIACAPNDQTAKRRVYMQYRGVDVGSLGDLTIDGECSCGEHSPCVHIAAVSIAAAKSLGRPRGNPRNEPDSWLQPAHGAASQNSTAQQLLCYLVAAPDVERREFTGAREFQLSVWVAQTLVGSRHIQAGACAFVPRTSDGNGEYPRYVDARDREILKALTVQHIDGPWDMIGATGFDLLQRAVATGRALWQSPQGQALRSGAARHVPFAWQALPNGDQRLCCEASGSLNISLAVEPAIYVDTASNECGSLELPYPLDLLRQYWN